MLMRKLLLSGMSVSLLACAGQGTHIPEYTSDSALTYQARCSQCHALPHPKRHTVEQWQHIVGMMEKRMQERKFTRLTQQERDDIMTYLEKHAR